MPTVLVIEDEQAIADTLLYALKTEGFEVHYAGTGAEGLQLFTEHSIDFVVLDIGLPDQLGFDVCRRLRETSKVPVLFLTARDSELDQVLGLELGADDYVCKPFSPRAVVARIRAVLRRTSSPPSPSPQNLEPRQDFATIFLHHDEEAMTIFCFGKIL